MANDKKKIEVKYEMLVIIWAALLFSQVMFVAVVYFVKPELFSLDFSKPPLGDQPLITIVFAIIAIATLGLSVVLRRQHMERAARDHDEGCVGSFPLYKYRPPKENRPGLECAGRALRRGR